MSDFDRTCRELFAKVDTDGSGLVDGDELSEMLQLMGVPEEEIQDKVKQMLQVTTNSIHPGRLNSSEFVLVARELAENGGEQEQHEQHEQQPENQDSNKQQPEPKLRVALSQAKLSYLRTMFHELDEDRSGEIGVSELTTILRDTSFMSCSRVSRNHTDIADDESFITQHSEAIMKILDESGDGVLNFDEFCNAVAPLIEEDGSMTQNTIWHAEVRFLWGQVTDLTQQLSDAVGQNELLKGTYRKDMEKQRIESQQITHDLEESNSRLIVRLEDLTRINGRLQEQLERLEKKEAFDSDQANASRIRKGAVVDIDELNLMRRDFDEFKAATAEAWKAHQLDREQEVKMFEAEIYKLSTERDELQALVKQIVSGYEKKIETTNREYEAVISDLRDQIANLKAGMRDVHDNNTNNAVHIRDLENQLALRVAELEAANSTIADLKIGSATSDVSLADEIATSFANDSTVSNTTAALCAAQSDMQLLRTEMERLQEQMAKEHASTQREISDLQAKLKEEQAKLTEKQTKLKEEQSKAAAATHECETLKSKMAELTAAATAATAATAAATARCDELLLELQKSKQLLAEANKRADKHAADATEAEKRATEAEKRVVEAERRVAEAEQSATEAEKRAAEAEKRAEEAHSMVDAANKRAIEAAESAAAAEKRATEAEKRAEAARSLVDAANIQSVGAERAETAALQAKLASMQAELDQAKAKQESLDAIFAKLHTMKEPLSNAESVLDVSLSDAKQAYQRASEAEAKALAAEQHAINAEQQATVDEDAFKSQQARLDLALAEIATSATTQCTQSTQPPTEDTSRQMQTLSNSPIRAILCGAELQRGSSYEQASPSPSTATAATPNTSSSTTTAAAPKYSTPTTTATPNTSSSTSTTTQPHRAVADEDTLKLRNEELAAALARVAALKAELQIFDVPNASGQSDQHHHQQLDALNQLQHVLAEMKRQCDALEVECNQYNSRAEAAHQRILAADLRTEKAELRSQLAREALQRCSTELRAQLDSLNALRQSEAAERQRQQATLAGEATQLRDALASSSKQLQQTETDRAQWTDKEKVYRAQIAQLEAAVGSGGAGLAASTARIAELESSLDKSMNAATTAKAALAHAEQELVNKQSSWNTTKIAELEKALQDANATLAATQTAHAVKCQTLLARTAELQSEVDVLRPETAAEILKLQVTYQNEKQVLKQEIDSLKQALEKMSKLQGEANHTTAALTKSHATEVAALQEQLHNVTAQHAADCAALAAAQRQLKTSQSRHQADVASLVAAQEIINMQKGALDLATTRLLNLYATSGKVEGGPTIIWGDDAALEDMQQRLQVQEDALAKAYEKVAAQQSQLENARIALNAANEQVKRLESDSNTDKANLAQLKQRAEDLKSALDAQEAALLAAQRELALQQTLFDSSALEWATLTAGHKASVNALQETIAELTKLQEANANNGSTGNSGSSGNRCANCNKLLRQSVTSGGAGNEKSSNGNIGGNANDSSESMAAAYQVLAKVNAQLVESIGNSSRDSAAAASELFLANNKAADYFQQLQELALRNNTIEAELIAAKIQAQTSQDAFEKEEVLRKKAELSLHDLQNSTVLEHAHYVDTLKALSEKVEELEALLYRAYGVNGDGDGGDGGDGAVVGLANAAVYDAIFADVVELISNACELKETHEQIPQLGGKFRSIKGTESTPFLQAMLTEIDRLVAVVYNQGIYNRHLQGKLTQSDQELALLEHQTNNIAATFITLTSSKPEGAIEVYQQLASTLNYSNLSYVASRGLDHTAKNLVTMVGTHNAQVSAIDMAQQSMVAVSNFQKETIKMEVQLTNDLKESSSSPVATAEAVLLEPAIPLHRTDHYIVEPLAASSQSPQSHQNATMFDSSTNWRLHPYRNNGLVFSCV